MNYHSAKELLKSKRVRKTAGALLVLFMLVKGFGCDKAEQASVGGGGPGAHDEHKEAEEHKEEVQLSTDAIKRYGIVVEAARKHILTPTLTAPGRVSFNTDAMAHVGAVLQGRVTDLKVKKGDIVKKGDELLVVESPDLGEAQSDFLQKRTTVATAQPAVELAKSAYDRAKNLYDENRGIALTELQKRESDFKAAQGTLLSAQSAFTAAENKLHLLGMDQQGVETLAKSSEIQPNYTVRAPISGQVISREVTLGELVNPEKESLLVVADMSTLWIIADVPEARMAGVAIGANARVKIAALSSEAIGGMVSFIDSSLDANTRSGRVRVEIKNSNTAIRPGMFCQAEIATATGQEGAPVLAVPDDAVQTVEGTPAVFVPVPGEENTFMMRPVEVSKSVGNMLAVVSGLKEGEPVVVAGSFVLKAELGKGAADHH